MHTDSICPHDEDGNPTASTVWTTTLADLMAAVQSAVAPGEEALVVPIVAHMLQAGGATWSRPSTRERQ